METMVARNKCRKVVVKYITVLQWLPQYTKLQAGSDFIAGITIGLTMIPQSIAYAALGGLTAQYGLYSSFLGGLIYLIFGTVKEVTIGPSSLMALLTLNYTRDMPVDFVILLTFLSGCIELMMGLLNLGFLVDFISIPVTSGFTSATSVIIIVSQLQGLVGLKYNSRNILDNIYKFFQNLHKARFNDSLLGISSIVILLCFRKLQSLEFLFVRDEKKKALLKKIFWLFSISRNAFIVMLSLLISMNIHTLGQNPFILSGHVQSGFPKIKPPPFSSKFNDSTYNFVDMCSHLGSGIIVVPLIAVLANVAIAKAFATTSGVNASQEMRTLGICNILGSFVSSMPTAGAFTRSAVSSASGIQTPMAGLYTGILAMLALTYLTPYFYFIPRATLSAVLICAVMFMIDLRVVFVLWKGNKIDAISFLMTFVMSLLLSIELGLLTGILLNVFYLLYLSARPSIEVSYSKTNHGQKYILVTPDAGFFYPEVEFIINKLYKIITTSHDENIPLVLDCSKFRGIDYTAVKGFERLITKCEEKGKKIIFVKVNSSIIKRIHNLSHKGIIIMIDNIDDITKYLVDEETQEKKITNLQFMDESKTKINKNVESEDIQLTSEQSTFLTRSENYISYGDQ